MKDVEIREALRSDLTAVVAVYNLMWTDSRTPLNMKMAKNFFEGLARQPSHHMYVATVEERIVGVFVLLMKQAQHGCEAILENVAVHPKFQGKGIGKTILRFVIGKCRERGCKRVIHSSSEKRGEALGFYEAHGFRREGPNLVLDI